MESISIQQKKAIFQDRNALSGNQIIKFVKKFKNIRIFTFILNDLNEIPVNIPENSVFLVNVTKNDKKGMHWIVLKNEKEKIVMFDSYNLPLSILPTKWKNKVVKSDNCVFQNKDSIVCGQYCALYVLNEEIMTIFTCVKSNSKNSMCNDVLCMFLYNYLNKQKKKI